VFSYLTWNVKETNEVPLCNTSTAEWRTYLATTWYNQQEKEQIKQYETIFICHKSGESIHSRLKSRDKTEGALILQTIFGARSRMSWILLQFHIMVMFSFFQYKHRVNGDNNNLKYSYIFNLPLYQLSQKNRPLNRFQFPHNLPERVKN